MYVDCEKCEQRIRSSDMNLDNMVAKCRNCDALIDLRGHLVKDAPGAMISVQGKGSPAPIPPGWTVLHPRGELEISYHWFEPRNILLLFFCVGWDSGLVFWYSQAFQKGDLLLLIFPIAHLAVGVFLTYYMISTFLNRTVIKVKGRELSVTHGPMPCFRNRKCIIHDLRDINVHETASYFTSKSGRRSIMYQVDAVKTDGQSIPLLQVKSDNQAAFVKEKLKKQLALS